MKIAVKSFIIPALVIIFIMVIAVSIVKAEEGVAIFDWLGFEQPEINGFCEMLIGGRTQDDPHEKDMSVCELRLQGEAFTYNDWLEIKYKGDAWLDGITEEVEYDTRELWIFSRPTNFIDLKIGRQILTWGTGNLVFLNDMFPKDWQSFFIGRDKEYLKAPSDALKICFCAEIVSVDIIYIPKFNPDRFISGEYISYWSAGLNKIVGEDNIVDPYIPDEWFDNDEIAFRIYGSLKGFELALYGYMGFWKTPEGQDESGNAIFPKLNTYGFSMQGPVGAGIANVEFAYYYSYDDESGANPLVKNSQIRYLAGYSQELWKNATGALQYYVEQMLDYDSYKENLRSSNKKDQFR
ncbi:MAG: hypothetical protein PVG39_29935, partial [Desulfobacteraceae bacterium]